MRLSMLLQTDVCHAHGLHAASTHAAVTGPWQTVAAVFKELVTFK